MGISLAWVCGTSLPSELEVPHPHANEITDEVKKTKKQKTKTLYSPCGAKTYKLIRNLATPRPNPYNELVTLVGNHYNLKPSVIVQRFKFHSHFTKQSQTAANFVSELWQFSRSSFQLDNVLRGRLVCSINNDNKQRCLLGETPPLTFKKALEISQGMEMAANNAKDFQKRNGGAQTAAVHQVRRETGKLANRVECFRCGEAHYVNVCKFKDTVCHACNKKGHLAKKCRSSKGKGIPGLGKTQAGTHHLDQIHEEAVYSYNMFGVETDEEPPEPMPQSLSESRTLSLSLIQGQLHLSSVTTFTRH